MDSLTVTEGDYAQVLAQFRNKAPKTNTTIWLQLVMFRIMHHLLTPLALQV